MKKEEKITKPQIKNFMLEKVGMLPNRKTIKLITKDGVFPMVEEDFVHFLINKWEANREDYLKQENWLSPEGKKFVEEVIKKGIKK